MGFGGLALMGDGTVWLFGLTNGVWLQLDVSGIVAIDGDYLVALALKSDGTVWDLDYPKSAQVQGISRAVSVSIGEPCSMALADDGTVWEWGGKWTTPRQVAGLTKAIKIAAGWYHNLALLADGTVWTWRY